MRHVHPIDPPDRPNRAELSWSYDERSSSSIELILTLMLVVSTLGLGKPTKPATNGGVSTNQEKESQKKKIEKIEKGAVVLRKENYFNKHYVI